MAVTKQNNFDKLIDNVYQTHYLLQENAQRSVNQNLTIRNWIIGNYIVEFEQNGEDRAQYGTKLLENMAKKIKAKGIKGLDLRTLRSCRTFYMVYPQIRQAVTANFEKAISTSSIKPLPIRGSVTPELQTPEYQHDTIRGSVSREFKQAKVEDVIITAFEGFSIQQTASAKLQEEYPIPSEIFLSRLSFTHFVELLRKNDPLERLFYEVETIKNNWSVRELARAMDTALYIRTGLSKNKESIIAKFKNQKPAQNVDVIRDPYFLEFLGLEEKTEYSESELEQAILNNLQHFLIELGTGFCFEARQKRITFDNTHYRIDLVFYHRILKSHFLIDLKIGKFDHADAGQMNVYLNYFTENEMSEGDNPPIGLILCGDKNETLARYATTGIDNQLFVSKYLVNLPDKKVLEEFIRKELV
ncbi:MAG: PDDEXK nuclease domain-containing protein [Paludibacter sp.]|jgi:predicted nuclease of restriction endonuclease-like (RecB) superfamily|nr:PDDEXK nuclease domain-containing protein [Paludibacter sp.]